MVKSMTIFRSQLFGFLAQAEERLRQFVAWGEAEQAFARNQARIDDGGHLVSA